MAKIDLKRKKPPAPIRKRKGAEDKAKDAVRFSFPGAKVIKAADMRQCRNCGAMIPKADEEPDLIVMHKWFYIEVKETSGPEEKFYPYGAGGFTPIQLRRFQEAESYIFLKLNWKAVHASYFVPWVEWRLTIESAMKKDERESIDLPWMNTHKEFDCWRCVWHPGNKEHRGYWQLPNWIGGEFYE